MKLVEDLTPEDLPLIVFSDMTSGFVQWLIKWRTKAHWNHCMIAHKPGLFASQGNRFSEVPYERYMKRGNRLKFVEVIGLSVEAKAAILNHVEEKLALPWWRNLYDVPGIVGQALGISWFNMGKLNYCSEAVALHLFDAHDFIEDQDLRAVIAKIPLHGSPRDINDYFKANPAHFRAFAHFDADDS